MKQKQWIVWLFFIFFLTELGFASTPPGLMESFSSLSDSLLNLEKIEVKKCGQSATQLIKHCLDKSVLTVKEAGSSPQKKDIQKQIAKYSKVQFRAKGARAAKLMSDWQCQSAGEAYALALSLENNFPDAEAMLWARELITQAGECQDFSFKEESLLRGALFNLLVQDLAQARILLEKIKTDDLQLKDRLLYLRRLAKDPTVDVNFIQAQKPMAIGMYGHLLTTNANVLLSLNSHFWTLPAVVNNEKYEQLLQYLLYFSQQGKKSDLLYLAGQLDFRVMAQQESPHYLVTLALIFNKSQIDLAVFKLMHHVVSKYPDHISRELIPLLFPIRYWDLISKYGNEVFDPILVKSLIRQESAFSTQARSSAQAMGLMQLIPSTARLLGLKETKKLYEAEPNIRVGSLYIKRLVSQFGSIELALAGYNAGPKRVEEWKKRYQTTDMDLFVELIPFRETREYVRLIRRNEAIYRQVLKP